MNKKTTATNEVLSFATITPSGITVPDFIERKTSSSKWVNFGEDNKLPDYLWDNYLKCSNLQSIVNTVVDYIIGDGVEHNFLFDEKQSESIEEVIKKCVFDYILFGGFTVEGIRNKNGEIVNLNYINVMNVRVNDTLDTAYLSNKWGNYTGKNVIELPLYKKDEKQPHFIFYYRGAITRNIYPIPVYASALKSVAILNNTRNFHLRNLENNFTSSVIINLNNGNIKTRELEEIKKKLEDNYCGSENAGKFLLINGGDKEHAATVERLDADNFGDLYKSLSDSSKDDIFVAFRMNPILMGQNVQSGFSKQEFEQAYALYNRTVIKPLQNNVIKAFNNLGIEVSFKPIVIEWGD